ncbi:MAG: hypothetical protein RMN25_11945 [Anaerolineae bacterium]|nr:hypothetical protein [Thermoflexales bacterium]MDW8408482.1 hypothetical protein [Anaerolineae bacterium]
MNVPRKDGVLRIVTIVYKVLAWIVLVVGVVGGLILLVAAQQIFAGIYIGGMNLIGLVVIVIGLVNFASLFITGATAEAAAEAEYVARVNQDMLEQLTRMIKSGEVKPASAEPVSLPTTAPARPASEPPLPPPGN